MVILEAACVVERLVVNKAKKSIAFNKTFVHSFFKKACTEVLLYCDELLFK